jgi:hypothetical protein
MARAPAGARPARGSPWLVRGRPVAPATVGDGVGRDGVAEAGGAPAGGPGRTGAGDPAPVRVFRQGRR